MLLKHNFVYHPSQEDEFWIDWYKYPFRNSYCNKDLSKKEILDIFENMHKMGRTIILVTHEPDVAMRASRQLLVRDGLITRDEGKGVVLDVV